MDKQQFLILGKSARGRALCELINRATAEPGIFTFGELLSLPNVQEVRAGMPLSHSKDMLQRPMLAILVCRPEPVLWM